MEKCCLLVASSFLKRLGRLIGQNVSTIIIEMVQLENPAQSSTETRYTCEGNICPPSAAIDGDLATRSVTYYGNDVWWQVEMLKTTLIDHILIHASDYAMGKGYYNK